MCGVVGPTSRGCRPGGESENVVVSGRRLESAGVEGDTPVRENPASPGGDPK